MFATEASNVFMEEPEHGREQVVLILVGLVASGKSTFAKALEDYFPQFRRCNQDDLGDRRRVEELARQSLREGRSVCIDRTNFDASIPNLVYYIRQRSHWIGIAREFPRTSIWLIVFDTPYEVCAARLRERTGHPTIKSPEQGLSILSRFATNFQRPTAYEGYDRIISLTPSDLNSAVYSRSDIISILQRVRDAPLVTDSGTHVSASNSRRGSYPFRVRYTRGRSSLHVLRGRGRGSLAPTSTNAHGTGIDRHSTSSTTDELSS